MVVVIFINHFFTDYLFLLNIALQNSSFRRVNLKSMIKLLLTASFTMVTFVAISQGYVPSYTPRPYYGPNPYYNSIYTVPKTVIERNSKAYLFTIVYKDSTKEVYRSKIDEYNKMYYLAIDQPGIMKSVKASETISISRISEKGELYIGISTDSCWLFKIRPAKINLYSVLAEKKTKFAVAMQVGNDTPIIPITRKNLEAIIPNNSSAWPMVQSGDFIKAIEMYNNEK